MLSKWLQRQNTTEETALLEELKKACSGIDMIHAFTEGNILILILIYE